MTRQIENQILTTDKTCRIFLAYDGSINADWVSRYAIRIAANSPGRKLFLLHILDGVYSPEEIRLKIRKKEGEKYTLVPIRCDGGGF